MSEKLSVSASKGGLSFPVKVKPNAKRKKIEGITGGVLVVSLTSTPIEGKANKDLVRFMSEILDVPASSITITHGMRGRNKRLEISGLEEQALAARLKG
ncbi:MAG: DUF167 domain-containing protein [Chloroflexi bacterium]|nr:DUF167 domain-containing protein [Chloroflexota bacterium]